MKEIPLKPARTCDVVMKGGVTSGIVYPPAVVELAGDFRFVSIGGTSAGAIAAALTAAAEYRRRNGSSEGFTRYLAGLPKDLATPSAAGKSKLFSLFQPDPGTRPIFDSIIGAIEERTIPGKIRRVLKGCFAVAPLHSTIAILLWLSIAILTVEFVSNVGPFAAAALTAILGLSFVAVFGGWLFFTAWHIFGRVADNAFGLCRGLATGSNTTGKPLTLWLADLIDEVAGKSDPAEPLTFGDLEGKGNDQPDITEDAKIVLRMMTTNLTHGRPYQMPFENGTFYFDPEEMRGFFPERIVRWMADHSIPHGISNFRSLPKTADLPVVVAARLSLSFPLLVSAVPLYAVDTTREENHSREAMGRLQELERCWFSDGGICSNFPVHLFDGPLPSRPTFAINLREFHPDHPRDLADESRNVWMPRTNGGGDHEHWTRFDAAGGPWTVMKFLEAILDCMQNWVDNTQLKVPGYRDRVAHISLAGEEGGLNLDMDANLVARLTRRGAAAGTLLSDRFTGRDPFSELDWDNHRWVRYRSTMTVLEEYLGRMRRSYEMPPIAENPSYPELVRRPVGTAPVGFPWPLEARDSMVDRDADFQQFIRAWLQRGEARFKEGTPKPVPEIRMRPRL